MDQSTPDVAPYFSATLSSESTEDDDEDDVTPIASPQPPVRNLEFAVNYILCEICIRYMMDYPPVPEKMDNGLNRLPLCMCDKCKARNGF